MIVNKNLRLKAAEESEEGSGETPENKIAREERKTNLTNTMRLRKYSSRTIEIGGVANEILVATLQRRSRDHDSRRNRRLREADKNSPCTQHLNLLSFRQQEALNYNESLR